MNLTQKETELLKDLKSQEKLCIEKYNKYSEEACDGKLKSLFSQIGQVEQQHLNTLNQIGGTPTQAESTSQPATASPDAPAQTSQCSGAEKQKDAFLCSDALTTEKHASSLYDTSIFEFKDPATRYTLNQIQKEEQGHGEKIYNYMSQNNMYS